jgi:hypothetical protein
MRLRAIGLMERHQIQTLALTQGAIKNVFDSRLSFGGVVRVRFVAVPSLPFHIETRCYCMVNCRGNWNPHGRYCLRGRRSHNGRFEAKQGEIVAESVAVIWGSCHYSGWSSDKQRFHFTAVGTGCLVVLHCGCSCVKFPKELVKTDQT